MCETLDNQLFYLDEMNTYQRYSEADKRIVTYHTKGMVLGENLPPISNHFHWCRSTITYLIDKDIRKKYSEITKEWIKEHKKTINNATIKQYRLKEKFMFRGKEYTYDNKLVRYDLSHGEKEFAEWLSNKIDSKIKIMPNIDVNGGVSAPDYIIKGKSYDLKTLLPETKDKQPIYHNIYKKSKQAFNFFIDGSNSKYTFEQLSEEAQRLFNRPDIKWVEIIGIKKNEKFVIYSRK